MIEQIKIAGIAAATTASGGAAILNEQTLLPLGIFITGIGLACIAAWRVSATVTRASDRLQRIEERITTVELKCNQCAKK